MVAEHLLHSALVLHCSQSSACGRMGMAGFALFSAETGHAKTVARTYFASVRDRLRSRLDRKSTRLNSVTNAHLVCRLLLEKIKEPSKILNTVFKSITCRSALY